MSTDSVPPRRFAGVLSDLEGRLAVTLSEGIVSARLLVFTVLTAGQRALPNSSAGIASSRESAQAGFCIETQASAAIAGSKDMPPIATPDHRFDLILSQR